MPSDDTDQKSWEASHPHIANVGRATSRLRVLIKRRAIGRYAVEKIAPGLDMFQLEVIEHVERGERKGREMTVGSIAEHMRLDPSRASRMVSNLVENDVFERGVSQQDARRAVLHLTETGRQLLKEKRRFKNKVMEEIFEDWSQDDISTFGDLFTRFVTRFEEVSQPAETDEPALAVEKDS